VDFELYELLTEVGRAGFLTDTYRVNQFGPEVMAAVRGRGDCADVVVMYGRDHAYAYRTPTGDGIDELDPAQVFWWYGAPPVPALRKLLDLPAPGEPHAPTDLTDAPPGAGLPADRRGTPVRIRRRGT
jgi:hypothetical protein